MLCSDNLKQHNNSDYRNIASKVTVNTWDYTGYGWKENGITLSPFSWCPITIENIGSTQRVELASGKVRIKITGIYLIVSMFSVKNTVNGQPYYDMGIFKNDIEIINIIINNSRGGGNNFMTRYSLTGVFYFQENDLIQPKIYSDLADTCCAVDINFIMLHT